MIETIENGIARISVNSFGAELTSFQAVSAGKELLWQGDSRYWKGQSIILFPIIGGLPDDKYSTEGMTYEMRPHGFARHNEFELVEKTPDTLVYRLVSSEETLKQYPYRFEFLVSYRLVDNKLIHGFKVSNLDQKDMLFSVGGHPGFFCPAYGNEKMEDYRLVFEKKERLHRRFKGKTLLTGEKELFLDNENEKALSHAMFYKGAVILDSFESRWLEIRSAKNGLVLRFEFAGFPYLGIWSAGNDAPFVCIEPWYGVDSTEGDAYDFRMKEGLQSLKPGASFQCAYTIGFTLDQVPEY